MIAGKNAGETAWRNRLAKPPAPPQQTNNDHGTQKFYR